MFPPFLNQELDILGWRLADATLTFAEYQVALTEILHRLFNCSAVVLRQIDCRHGNRTLDCLPRCPGMSGELPCTGTSSENRQAKCSVLLSDRNVYARADNMNDQGFDALGECYGRKDASRVYLDALVAINGKVFGLLTCHMEAGQRRWAIEEETTLKRLSVRVAIHLTRLNPARFSANFTDLVKDVVNSSN